MIWRSNFHNKIVKIADAFSVILGFIIAYYIWGWMIETKVHQVATPFMPDLKHYLLLAIISLLFVGIFSYFKAYSYQRFTSLIKEYMIVLKVSFLGLLMFVFLFYMIGEKEIPRSVFLTGFFVILALLLFQKTLLFYLAGIIRKRGLNRKRVLIVGSGTRATSFLEIVERNFNWGLDIIGLLTGDASRVGGSLLNKPILAHYDDIEKILRDKNPQEVIITISTKRFDHIRNILNACEDMGVQVRLNSDFFGYITKHVSVDKIFGLNIISFTFSSVDTTQLMLKRTMDIGVSVLALVILSPLFLIASVLIFFQDGFPIFYKWNIIGYNRIPIVSWKFRTMVKNADELKKNLRSTNEMSGPMFKMTNDPRVFPIGKFLRKYSIDELPQLFSVLKGDLSLVGPRPPLRYEFKEFELWQRRKMSVKPGLTCLWQISGRNDINNFDDWIRLDLEYIDNWSLLLDLKILLKTIPVVLFGKGAK